MRREENKIVSIYAIKNPLTGEVFYVGATLHPKKRFAFHTYGGTWRWDSYRYQQVRSLWLAKVKPEFIILAETDSIENAKVLEQHWIDHYVSQGLCTEQRRGSAYAKNTYIEMREKIKAEIRAKRGIK
jgi:hypothetical protein